MFSKIRFWLECSRWYALPMTIFSWLIVFCYGMKNNGNLWYGIIALFGICFAHLATNLFDDFCDYHKLDKITDPNNNIILPNTQRGKCRYITEDKVKLSEVLTVVSLYSFLALLIGLFFYFIWGKDILIFAGIGALIIFGYSFCSYIRLSELAVGLAFGPLLFTGTYYAMTGEMSLDALILSLPSMFFTVNLIYTDTFLDKEIDKQENKKTLVNSFSSDDKALDFQKTLIFWGYFSVLFLPVLDIADWEIFAVLLTVPLAIDLFKSLKIYSNDTSATPEKKWYHFPFEAWEDIKNNRSETFMFRMYQARNLMIYNSIIIATAIWLNY
ncbi:MAG: prenyltransferase [Cyanobacteria bacterium RUI128]|nr:prenyltransferase [Cyanobacteria bacterium RUI128]